MTIDDLRNPKRKSGFNHVSVDNGGSSRPKPYRAEVSLPKRERVVASYEWRGPRRATPDEAAQDYCDYVKGNPLTSAPSVPTMRGGLKTAGHKASRTPEAIPSDVEAAYGMIRDFRAQQAGKPGYVYLIIEDNVGGSMVYGKVGYSTNPQARVRELQTGNPRPLKLYCAKLGTLDDELAIHKRTAARNLHVLQEWFLIDRALLLEWDAKDIIKDKEAA